MWRSYVKLGHPVWYWVSAGWASLVRKLGPIPWEFWWMSACVSNSIPLLLCKHFYWIKVFNTFIHTALGLHSSSPVLLSLPLSLLPASSHFILMSLLFCAGNHGRCVSMIATALLHLEGTTSLLSSPSFSSYRLPPSSVVFRGPLKGWPKLRATLVFEH